MFLYFLKPIKEIGKESPGAFMQYQHMKTPDTNYSKETLENSLSSTDVRHFCEYFLCLFNCGIKQDRQKVMGLIGDPNSGKISLFMVITRIIPARYLLNNMVTHL